jgi:hypothetical protein
MPDLNEFLKPKIEIKEDNLEKLEGIRACNKCDEDVSGAFWDPIDLVMSWKCSQGHETLFKVN